jgi:hypothetical protein
MATVLEPRSHAQPPERIRHPLQAVRAKIRKYVISEGAALAVIFLAAWFWIGLILDWGVFAIFSYDWVQELQHLDESKSVAFYVRLVVLLGLLGCLAVLAITKMVMRLTKEFSDAAVALVLERRFPRELGDRLITAVEMADPKLAASLGYSQQMVEQTIQEAGERVAALPVDDVFDWQRLRKQWLLAGLLTLGLLVVVAGGTMAVGAATGAASPIAHLGDFTDTATIWTERNVFLQDSYWPRRAYLEVVRFQDTPSHPGEMRLGRDEQRPDLVVRAIEWVVADRSSPDGWRALRWSDLPKYIEPTLLDRVTIPNDFGGWIVDLDDLPNDIAGNVLPAAWQGKTAREVREELKSPPVRAALAQAGADKAADDLLDWRQWTVDKIKVQDERPEVHQPLRERDAAAYTALEEVFSRLERIAASASMSRTLRKLTVPAKVEYVYRGETTKVSNASDLRADRKFAVDLNEFKESGRLRVRGEDYWTRPLRITMVPPPSIVSVKVDKEEPAYIYHRLQGKQTPLKGKKQIFKDYDVSATGDTTTIDIPIGSNLTLKARVDRELKPGIRIRPPSAAGKETGSVVPDRPVERDADGQGYTTRFDNITKTLDFNVEYQDLDNVHGKRRFRIRPIDDQPPEIISAELAAVLRKPRFKSEPSKTGGGLTIDGYLITPDALLPFGGTIRDDYGLTRADWVFETELVDFQLSGGGDPTKDRTGFLLSQGNVRARRAGLVASALQFHPAALQPAVSTAYWAWVKQLFDAAAKHQAVAAEETIGMDGFKKRLETVYEIPLSALADKLTEKLESRPRFKEHSLKDEEGFDLRLNIPRLKPKEAKDAQQLYFLRLSITATDNNVETGPSTSRTKAPFFFIVVSENDLLVQIAFEEEAVSERLEKAREKLNSAKISVSEQMAKLPTGGDLSLVAIRADEIRKAVIDGATVAREVHADYSRILRELEVNRCRRTKIDAVRTKIVQPLDELLNPNFGEFQSTEEASHRFYLAVDDDVTAKRPPNVALHLKNAQDTRDQLEVLLNKINDILIAMGEGITEARALQILLDTADRQEKLAREWDRFHRAEVDRILRSVLEPDGKK